MHEEQALNFCQDPILLEQCFSQMYKIIDKKYLKGQFRLRFPAVGGSLFSGQMSVLPVQTV